MTAEPTHFLSSLLRDVKNVDGSSSNTEPVAPPLQRLNQTPPTPNPSPSRNQTSAGGKEQPRTSILSLGSDLDQFLSHFELKSRNEWVCLLLFSSLSNSLIIL